MAPFVVQTLDDPIDEIWALAATLIGHYGLLEFGISSAVSPL